VLVLLAVAGVLAVGAAVLGPLAGLVTLLVASAFLLAAAAVGVRGHWVAALAEDAAVAATPTATARTGAIPHARPPSPGETVPDDLLGLRLRGLQERSADKVNRALAAGRTDLALELSDEYADEALRAITAAGPPPATPRP
jgi:hypothetical protein